MGCINIASTTNTTRNDVRLNRMTKRDKVIKANLKKIPNIICKGIPIDNKKLVCNVQSDVCILHKCTDKRGGCKCVKKALSGSKAEYTRDYYDDW